MEQHLNSYDLIHAVVRHDVDTIRYEFNKPGGGHLNKFDKVPKNVKYLSLNKWNTTKKKVPLIEAICNDKRIKQSSIYSNIIEIFILEGNEEGTKYDKKTIFRYVKIIKKNLRYNDYIVSMVKIFKKLETIYGRDYEFIKPPDSNYNTYITWYKITQAAGFQLSEYDEIMTYFPIDNIGLTYKGNIWGNNYINIIKLGAPINHIHRHNKSIIKYDLVNDWKILRTMVEYGLDVNKSHAYENTCIGLAIQNYHNYIMFKHYDVEYYFNNTYAKYAKHCNIDSLMNYIDFLIDHGASLTHYVNKNGNVVKYSLLRKIISPCIYNIHFLRYDARNQVKDNMYAAYSDESYKAKCILCKHLLKHGTDPMHYVKHHAIDTWCRSCNTKNCNISHLSNTLFDIENWRLLCVLFRAFMHRGQFHDIIYIMQEPMNRDDKLYKPWKYRTRVLTEYIRYCLGMPMKWF